MPDEYISREAALKAANEWVNEARMAPVVRMSRLLDKLAKAPAADVAEVVRCKDCRHSKYAAWCEGYACCRTVGEYHHADFGCTDGKLRTNGVTE